MIGSYVLGMITGPIITDRLNERNALFVDQLARQREREQQEEKIKILTSIPSKLSYNVQRHQRISTFDVTCTNVSESPVVIDAGSFFRIRGMEEKMGAMCLAGSIVQVRIIDTATGRDILAHQRLEPKAVMSLRVEAIRPMPSTDARVIKQALASGRLRLGTTACVDVPCLDFQEPNIHQQLEQGEFILYFGLSTSLGVTQAVRLGGV
jgi:hypothetical protein